MIIDPVPGDLLQKTKSQCEKFEKAHGVKVQICPKAGCSVKSDAKPDPLRKVGCFREDCLPCKSNYYRRHHSKYAHPKGSNVKAHVKDYEVELVEKTPF